jgi:hypothetical protein
VGWRGWRAWATRRASYSMPVARAPNFLGGGEDGAAVAGAEVDDEVAGADLGHGQHAVDERLGCGDPRDVLAGLAGRRARRSGRRGRRATASASSTDRRAAELGLLLASCDAAGSGTSPFGSRRASAPSPFACGQELTGVGTGGDGDAARLSHVRARGRAGPRLGRARGGRGDRDDGQWQHDGLVLLDFEDGSGACMTGSPRTNFEVRGSVPDARRLHRRRVHGRGAGRR